MSSHGSAELSPRVPETSDPLAGILVEDKKKFKTCSQIGFYRRQKLLLPDQSPYHAQLETLLVDDGSATLQILHQDTKIKHNCLTNLLESDPLNLQIVQFLNKVPLQLKVMALDGGIFRLKINEVSPLKPRYEVRDVLVTEPAVQRMNVLQKDSSMVVLEYPSAPYKLYIMAESFSVSVTCEDKLVLSANSQGLLYFEHLLTPPPDSVASKTDSDLPQEPSQDEFGESLDTKAGGTSVGLDFSLHEYEHVYGLPEHADSHDLQNTGENEAYRLYNLDVFGYPVHDKMGTYGSVPLLLGHKPTHTCGLFWLNASETLVEIHSKASLQNPLFLSSRNARKQRAVPQTNIRWMSESGIIDVFLLMGPAPQDVFSQYASLTGTQAFPPLFSLGYHQCRWNYEDEDDVEAVDSGFDEYGIPYDVIWLDIEHTEGKRYFTWDKKRFPDPLRMQEKLREKKRKLVVISDPHIKVDPNYTLYIEAKEKGYFVKDRTGKDFEGICWPGKSNYLDFTNPDVRDWYADQFALDKYKDSTDILFIWNDMNEPSVFEAPEMTMSKHEVHHQGWEHRDLHNLYGFYQQMSTADGLTRRSGGHERPFVLTRSFFAGSQRYGAVWTGDNKAEWEYLKISVPMLLSLSVAGISFCGADVGGFIGDPEPELLVRWYQAGAFQPFFRAHAIQDSKRREPWLFGEFYTSLIKQAIEERYTLLPYLYLLFYRAYMFAEPIMRPMWVEFPKQTELFGVETQYLLGNALMVVPVLDPKVSSLEVIFPKNGEQWYCFRKSECIMGPQQRKMRVTLKEIPVYQRGGSIITMYTSTGKSTGWMENSPYELRVALDSKGSAMGELFIDDGHSHLNKQRFCHRRFTYKKNVLSSRAADQVGQYHTESFLEMVVITGMKKFPDKIIVRTADGEICVEGIVYRYRTCVMYLNTLTLGIADDWDIHLLDTL